MSQTIILLWVIDGHKLHTCITLWLDKWPSLKFQRDDMEIVIYIEMYLMCLDFSMFMELWIWSSMHVCAPPLVDAFH